MNDNIIINTISKIHFVLASIISFIFLTLFVIFILLQNGIYIDSLSLPNIKTKQLYIKWNEKISIVAKELHVETNNKSEKLDYKKLKTTLEQAPLLSSAFKTISISNIFYNDTKGSFKYIDDEVGFLKLKSPDFTLNSSIALEGDLLNIDIDRLETKDKNLRVSGNILLSREKGLGITSSVKVDINSSSLNIYTDGFIDKLRYRVVSSGNIKNSREIIDLFDIDERTKYWMYDAIEMSSLSIKSAYGELDFEKMDEAYKNVHVEAVANDLKYRYDLKLQTIDTKYTDLEFKNGILYIRPQGAYTYNFFLDKSWLYIDFTKKEEMLTLFLKFNGQLNRDMLNLLKHYGIELPLIQTKGKLKSDLKLVINLISEDVTALGDFYSKKAKINYLGLDIDLFNARVFVDNTHVTIDNMFAKYKDIASADVDFDFNANESKGRIDFLLKKLSFKDKGLELVSTKKPLHVSYNIKPKQDYINIDSSTWNFKGDNIDVDKVSIPFNMDGLTAEIPSTSISIKEKLHAKTTGSIKLKDEKADLYIELSKLNYNDIRLDQRSAYLHLTYNGHSTLSSKDPLHLDISDKKLKLDNFALKIYDESIAADNISVNIDDSIKSKLSANYNLSDSEGFLDLYYLELKDKELGEIFKNSSYTTRVHVQNLDSKLSVTSKAYDFEYVKEKDQWVTKLNSIDKISDHSALLQKYGLIDGTAVVNKQPNQDKIEFTLNGSHKYKLLSKDHKLVDTYTLNGEYSIDSKSSHFSVNEAVDINITDSISIKASDIGFNIHGIMDLVDAIGSDKKGSDKTKVSLKAKDSYIYFNENRRAISDSIDLDYSKNVLVAELKHREGNALFRLDGDKLYLYGEKFNDKFMDNLFTFSKFKRGSLDFSITGTTDEFSGVFNIKDTRIVNYKILNNILAFVNTVPSLLTFKVPGYNTRGLKAESAYVRFNYKDDIYKLSDISLKSKEIDILGLGEVSLKNNTIDLDLNLKTDLGSAVSKIPLVGHILLGKDNVSTSLTVKGDLDDPKVDYQIVKDIAVAPLNIIKRTIMLPFDLFKSKDKKEKKKKEEDK